MHGNLADLRSCTFVSFVVSLSDFSPCAPRFRGGSYLSSRTTPVRLCHNCGLRGRYSSTFASHADALGTNAAALVIWGLRRGGGQLAALGGSCFFAVSHTSGRAGP